MSLPEVRLAPIRPLEDFLLESARFQAPDFNDLERWANRVVNNLLYYQTNYFVTSALVFLLVGVFNPVPMMLGLVAVCSVFSIFVYASNNRAELRSFKRHHPLVSTFLIVAGAYFLVHLFGSILVFFFGIALPLLFVLTHASTRLRNLKSKVSNKLEHFGVTRTPMGMLLEALGQEQEGGS